MDQPTIQFYRDQAQPYADWIKSPSTRLVRFLSLLAPGSSILELGCGAGNHAAVMLERGFVLRATDGSPEMAAIAAKRLGHPVERLLFHELDEREAYDGVWASACLLHVPRDELTAILGRIRRALRPSGLFYASYKLGDGEGRDSVGRYYNYPSRPWLEQVYDAAGGWTPVATDTSELLSFDGEPATMLHVMVRKSP